MEKNEFYIQEDVLGIPASSEEDARAKAIEQLEYIDKTCIEITDIEEVKGKSRYNVSVKYVDKDDYENIKGRKGDTIKLPASTKIEAIRKVREALEFQSKRFVDIKSVEQVENKQKYEVEVEYVEEEPSKLKQ